MDKCGQSGTPRNPRRQQRALRLVFEQHGDALKLVSTQRLSMIVPPPQALVPNAQTRGSWIELRDRSGQAVYRRQIENPLQDVEVVADAPGEPLRRVRSDHAGRAFFVIVPDIDGARGFVLHAEPRIDTKQKASTAAQSAGSTHEFDLSGIDTGAQ